MKQAKLVEVKFTLLNGGEVELTFTAPIGSELTKVSNGLTGLTYQLEFIRETPEYLKYMERYE